MSEAISVKGLTKSYLGKTVLNHLDLSVKAGTVFGLLGANGAGKSTAIECMQGSRNADSGEVFLLGRDPKQNRREVFQRIGMQFQEGNCQQEIKAYELCQTISPDCPALKGNSWILTHTFEDGKYAVYHFKGFPQMLFMVYQEVFCRWRSKTKYQLDERPIFDIYRNVGEDGYMEMAWSQRLLNHGKHLRTSGL